MNLNYFIYFKFRYTFGKVVEGIAHVSIKLARWFPWLRESQSFIKRIIVVSLIL